MSNRNLQIKSGGNKDEEINLTTGDWLRISPTGKRQFFASEDSELTYICIQVKENSLEGFTMDDGVIY